VSCTEKEREDGALRRKMLMEFRKLGHLTCYERRACSSWLPFCSIDSMVKLLSYTFIFYKLFYFVFMLNIIGHGNPDNNLESLCYHFSLYRSYGSVFGKGPRIPLEQV
jgi:hypothetical protein